MNGLWTTPALITAVVALASALAAYVNSLVAAKDASAVKAVVQQHSAALDGGMTEHVNRLVQEELHRQGVGVRT